MSKSGPSGEGARACPGVEQAGRGAACRLLSRGGWWESAERRVEPELRRRASLSRLSLALRTSRGAHCARSSSFCQSEARPAPQRGEVEQEARLLMAISAQLYCRLGTGALSNGSVECHSDHAAKRAAGSATSWQARSRRRRMPSSPIEPPTTVWVCRDEDAQRRGGRRRRPRGQLAPSPLPLSPCTCQVLHRPQQHRLRTQSHHPRSLHPPAPPPRLASPRVQGVLTPLAALSLPQPAQR